MYLLKTVIILTLFIFGFSSTSFAGVAVIVHPSNTSVVDQWQIRRMFLDKLHKFPNGRVTIPLDLPTGNATRTLFYEKVIKKNESEVNAYWSRMLFSAKGKPPKVVSTSAMVKELVAENPNLLAYINSDDVDSSVKVLLVVD